MMTSGFRVMLLFLGAGVIIVWTAVICLFVFNGQSPVTADTHRQAQIGIMANKESVSEDEWDRSDRDYARNNNKAYNSRQLSAITTTNKSGKVSIDTLLDELKIE